MPSSNRGPIKVLYVHPSTDLYGSDLMAVETVRALVANEANVTAVVPNYGPLTDRFRATATCTKVLNTTVLRKSELHPRRLPRFILQSLLSIIHAYRELGSDSFDIVYANTITQPAWAVAAMLRRIPLLVHVRESESEQNRLVRAALVFPLSFATHIICNSKSTKEFVTSSTIFPRVRRKCSVIYNGKEWGTLLQLPAKARDQELRIAVIGRLSPRKGQDVVIRALSRLQFSGIRATVEFAGDTFAGYEWFEQELQQLATELDVTERCKFLGYSTNISEVLERSDIAVVPSRQEPFGTVAAESMAALRPTIVSDVEGLLEIVEDHVNGLVFKSGDDEALAEQIALIANDDDLAQRIATAGRKSVEVRFSANSYCSAIWEIVRKSARR